MSGAYILTAALAAFIFWIGAAAIGYYWGLRIERRNKP